MKLCRRDLDQSLQRLLVEIPSGNKGYTAYLVCVSAGVAFLCYCPLFYLYLGSHHDLANVLISLAVTLLPLLLAMGVLALLIDALKLYRWLPASASALRELAGLSDKVTPIEAEYCRTVATLLETKLLTNVAVLEIVGALNSLLAGSRYLTQEEAELQSVIMEGSTSSLDDVKTRLTGLLISEEDARRRATLEQLLALNRVRQQDYAALSQSVEWLRLRQQVFSQTFVSLRGSLLRARYSEQEAGSAVSHFQGDAETQARDVQEVVARLQQQARSLEAATRELSQMH